jgi:PAS domain S-box-containing protein
VIAGLANHTILIARDGREIPIGDSAAPIRLPDGKLFGVVLVFRDVTEARRAEINRAWLAAIIDSSDDAIVSKTLDGQITSWNPGAARLFGYTPEEIIGKHIMTIVPLELRAEEEEVLARLRRGERVEHFETTRMARDGRRNRRVPHRFPDTGRGRKHRGRVEDRAGHFRTKADGAHAARGRTAQG